ncbi:patellin-4 [Rhododendron vialii]|uniref:patellin-4 n=1 Tax=Rhododendron vialii TaxID=182163 RepID=UPI00265EAEF4|nr:patellin-4 [Rhododendron vialii]XP_058197001.1 patellin-4 [Rhododendron vialii]
MTVEVISQETQVAEVVVSQQPEAEEDLKIVVKEVEDKKIEDEPISKDVEKSSSYREESNFPSDLKEHEKKALSELKSKLEEAVLGNNLFKKEEPKENAKEEPASEVTEEKVAEEQTEELKVEVEGETKPEEGTTEEKTIECVESEEKEEGKEGSDVVCDEGKRVEIDEDISIWGVPLLPSKGGEGLDVVLLKFLRARDFKVNDAYEMVVKTLQWRKEFKADSILDEDLGSDLGSFAYMSGVDREGHPICYNIFGAFESNELYEKAFGTEEKRERFLRWRFQLMEKGIQKLDFKAGGVNSLLQINDLRNSAGPSKKELRVATKQAVGLLQDNYPEFVARNIFINVPFWYYAFNALLSPFLTQRTRSKFVVARPGKVTETLIRYIPVEEIPIQYGGLKRENDFEFSFDDSAVSELIIKAGSTATVEINATEVGATFIWDLTVLGWEVNYKEEFVPLDEGSYSIIVQKTRKMSSNGEPIRNTFRTNEPGKIVLTIENCSSKKKKVLYRYKTKKSAF